MRYVAPTKDPRLQERIDRAAECDRLAASAHDQRAKETFVQAAKCWRELAAAISQLNRPIVTE